MKTSRYTDSQILNVLKQAENGIPVTELCREHGMSSATFYKWRAKDGGITPMQKKLRMAAWPLLLRATKNREDYRGRIIMMPRRVQQPHQYQSERNGRELEIAWRLLLQPKGFRKEVFGRNIYLGVRWGWSSL